jgi:hypothetical protein
VPSPLIRAYMGAHLVQGELDVKERRVSDFISDPNVSVLTVNFATWQDMLSPADNTPVPVESTRVRKDLVHLIVPGDAPSLLAPRVPTQPVPVHIGVGFYSVDGLLHRRVNESTQVDQIMRGVERLYLPITDVVLRYGLNHGFDAELPVVLVNTTHIEYWTAPRG